MPENRQELVLGLAHKFWRRMAMSMVMSLLRKLLLIGLIGIFFFCGAGTLCLSSQQPGQSPRLMKVGEKISVEDFRGAAGEAVRIEPGKPTVLWFCISITMPESFESALPMLDSLAERRGDKVNVYPIFGGCSKVFIDEKIAMYHYTRPVLTTNKYLNYTYGYPAVLIFDKEGVLRYRGEIELTDRILDTLR
ncbi:MAG TPA: hypothetical protein PKA28_10440 [Methylomusa anaerophila]|uniref:TlpA family protein disulfide reductase n=1 Tax=Methylomusa anaerophila TaxID=1930071 RepID=UPI002BF90647|nr:hypothetical protein [Methylomusa anaerophila]HML88852.1 hypothetical protein [Methylomusa anaerophila]